MHKKRALVLGAYLCLLTLAACGPKVVDDSDFVSFDYKYTLTDGTVLEEGSAEFTVGENSKYQWLESAIKGLKEDEEYNGTVNGREIYGYAYDENMVQAFPNLIMTEVYGVSDPEIGNTVNVSSFGDGVIISDGKDDEGYTYWVVDFNDPKTYSDLSYYVKITAIEKN